MLLSVSNIPSPHHHSLKVVTKPTHDWRTSRPTFDPTLVRNRIPASTRVATSPSPMPLTVPNT